MFVNVNIKLYQKSEIRNLYPRPRAEFVCGSPDLLQLEMAHTECFTISLLDVMAWFMKLQHKFAVHPLLTRLDSGCPTADMDCRSRQQLADRVDRQV